MTFENKKKEILTVVIVLGICVFLLTRKNKRVDEKYDECTNIDQWSDKWKEHCHRIFVDKELGSKHFLVNIPSKYDLNVVIDEVKQKVNSGEVNWTRNRHKAYPTTDIPICSSNLPETNKLKEVILREIIGPELESNFGIPKKEISYQEAFVVRYGASKDEQSSLEAHVDGSPLSFVCTLNEDFEGGGTRFVETGEVARPAMGQCAVFPGMNKHEGLPVTQGERWILTGFLNWGPTRDECIEYFGIQ